MKILILIHQALSKKKTRKNKTDRNNKVQKNLNPPKKLIKELLKYKNNLFSQTTHQQTNNLKPQFRKRFPKINYTNKKENKWNKIRFIFKKHNCNKFRINFISKIKIISRVI